MIILGLLEDVINDSIRFLSNRGYQEALSSAVSNSEARFFNMLRQHGDIKELAKEVEEAKKEVLSNIEYYIGKVMDSFKAANGVAHYAESGKDALEIIDKIIGDRKRILLSKSMTCEEVGLRKHLQQMGKEVWETDLGQLLIQLEGGKPMHATAPVIHMTLGQIIKLVRSKLGMDVREDESPQDIAGRLRVFLREKFIKSEVGISGANAVSADTGSVFLIENEGNIRLVTSLPPLHIILAGIEKIVPTMIDALKLVMVQSSYAGLFPPSYINVVSGPSATGDIGHRKVYGAHGPREVHLVLLNNGRKEANKNVFLREELRCIRCGNCQILCPVWNHVANTWGGKVYGGPMGVIWTAITEGIEIGSEVSQLCLGCKRCDLACPVEIPLSNIIHYLKTQFKKST